MGLPRAALVDCDTTPYYHCTVRCVRRAYLCGDDNYTQQNFDHRKQWIIERFGLLSRIFAIDVCAYAVMSNHFHLVVRIDRQRAEFWSDDEVIARHSALFPMSSRLIEVASEAKRAQTVSEWRERLWSLSWFMRCLNEKVAKRANLEDGCKGRFWEGRFHSQALLDEGALLACMAYVDLNPVRAGLASGVEDAAFTSIGQRIAEYAGNRGEAQTALVPMVVSDGSAGVGCNGQKSVDVLHDGPNSDDVVDDGQNSVDVEVVGQKSDDVAVVEQNSDDVVRGGKNAENVVRPGQNSVDLARKGQDSIDILRSGPNSIDVETQTQKCGARGGRDQLDRYLTLGALPISLVGYVGLVEATGRALRHDTRGVISGAPAALLEEHGLRADRWVESVRTLGGRFRVAVGNSANLANSAAKHGVKWRHGTRNSPLMYGIPPDT